MEQKFKRLAFVHIREKMPPYMTDYRSDFDAIVQGSHGQICGGLATNSYALYRIEDGKVVDRHIWYPANLLTELNPPANIRAERKDNIKARKMIKAFERLEDN